MKVTAQFGRSELATVFIAEVRENQFIEFVESVEPPIPRERKWVLIVSTLFGCPSKCLFCDAGRTFKGALTALEIFEQIDYLVTRRYPSRSIPSDKWKIQFARMGDPAFNLNVLDVLEQLPVLYNAPGLMPSISTIAPIGCDKFFNRLIEIKHRLYPYRFQFQFSIHSTDNKVRRKLIPIKTWEIERIAEYGREIYTEGGRKVALNFALIQGVPINSDAIAEKFDPEIFVIKVTPLNPTFQVQKNGLKAVDLKSAASMKIVSSLRESGFDVIISIGELAENEIGSNCGQYISTLERVA